MAVAVALALALAVALALALALAAAPAPVLAALALVHIVLFFLKGEAFGILRVVILIINILFVFLSFLAGYIIVAAIVHLGSTHIRIVYIKD